MAPKIAELRSEIDRLRGQNRQIALEVNRIGGQILEERDRADRMSIYQRQNDSLREEMRQAHCSMRPESMLDAMVLVQRARDAMLASQTHAALARAGSVVLIAGNGHARKCCIV